jgi:external thioesterase TEII
MLPQLFLLHFAGGNRYSYQFLTPGLADFEVVPLELPGRGKRIRETLIRDFNLAAEDLFKQVMRSRKSADFSIYGHSMGALLGLTLSSMLENVGEFPTYLFVSGNAGPGTDHKRNRHLLAHDEFVEELKKIGGVPDEFLKSRELFDFFEPVLRADFEIVENIVPIKGPIQAPIYAMMGAEEEYVEKISNWKSATRSDFSYEILEGGHFFIHKHPQRIARLLKKCVR